MSNRFAISQRFQHLFYAPGGHHYWRDNGTIRKNTIAISDDSGPTPDTTEDGILWLDLNRPIIASGTGFYIPLIVPNSSNHYKRNGDTFTSTCASPQEARMLVEHFNMKVSVDGLELAKTCQHCERNDHDDQHQCPFA